jgi:hypothetical protein
MNSSFNSRRVWLATIGLVTASLISMVTAPLPAQAPAQVPRIVGEWSGKTKEDGVLTLVVRPAPGRELSYQFSGGAQEHASGTFTLRGANDLEFTPTGESEAEKWQYSFDEQGQLHLIMEEDNPDDRELYILTRTR